MYDEKLSSIKDRQRVAAVIAHEQAHQWFGDLVTLNWWDNTWLNEGFATYFEYHTLALKDQDPLVNINSVIILKYSKIFM